MAKPSVPDAIFCKPRPSETVAAATEAAIAQAERSLDVVLPEDFKALLRVRNGGRLRLNLFTLKRTPPERSHARKKYHVPELAGVRGGPADDIVQLTELAVREWDLPAGLVPLFGDGHWWCCLDYRAAGSTGKPAVTHVETGEDRIEIPVAPSFTDFIGGLSRNPESLTPALIALDAGAPRGDGLHTVLVRLGFKKWKCPGLSNPRYPEPPAWEWGKYRSFVKGCEARVELWTNRLYDVSERLTDQRPQKHPMLRVSVAAAQEDACLGELLSALGPGAVLLHGLE